MARQPPQIAKAAVQAGQKKAHERWDKTILSGFLAGSYIAFGGLVAIAVSSGLDPATWGTLPTLFTGAAFTLGLILVLIAGSDLLTGNLALVPLSAFQKRISGGEVLRNLTLVLLGNVVGAMFVAYFLAVQTGVIGDATAEAGTGSALMYERLAGIAHAKGVEESAWQIFLRAVGANWLVCLAVWVALAAETISGKIIAMFFPIMAFVAMGFDHVVANMFFLPAAMFVGVPDLGVLDTLRNWSLALVGNAVGAVVFVSTSYWYLYLRDSEEAPPATATE